MKRTIFALAASVAAIAAAPAANAAVVFGYSINGGAITTVTPTLTGSLYTWADNALNYSVSLSANGPAGTPDLRTVAITVADTPNARAGTLNLFVTKTDVNSFSGGLLSSFNSNTLTGSANQVVISSYRSTSNATFGGSLLQTHTFNGLGTFEATNVFGPSAPSLWSETLRYDIRFTGGTGTFNGTANLAAVPEPATWAMMLLGFGAVGATLRSRRRSTTARIRFA